MCKNCETKVILLKYNNSIILLYDANRKTKILRG